MLMLITHKDMNVLDSSSNFLTSLKNFFFFRYKRLKFVWQLATLLHTIMHTNKNCQNNGIHNPLKYEPKSESPCATPLVLDRYPGTKKRLTDL